MKKYLLTILIIFLGLPCYAGFLGGLYDVTFYAVQTIYKNGPIESGGLPSTFKIEGHKLIPTVNGKETFPIYQFPGFMQIAEQIESAPDYDNGTILVTNNGYMLIYFNEEKGYANCFYFSSPGNPNTLLYRIYCSTDSSKAGSGASFNGGTSNGASTPSYSSPNRSSSGRTCPSCHGSGKGTEQTYYAPDYTGNQASVYCSQCGRTTSPHTHHTPSCPVCHGRGTVD